MKKILLTLIISTISCAHTIAPTISDNSTLIYKVDKTFVKKVIKQFEYDFKVRVTNKFYFENPGNGGLIDKVSAFCLTRNKTIHISKTIWYFLPKLHKAELLYHEMGHCVLNLSHPEKEDPNCIMRPSGYASKLDGSNWNFLVEKMRNKVIYKGKKCFL